MTRFIAFVPWEKSDYARGGLHVWREGAQTGIYLHALDIGGILDGAVAFECELGGSPAEPRLSVGTEPPECTTHTNSENIYCQLFLWDGRYQIESEPQHVHLVPRLPGNVLPRDVYLFHGSARAVAENPLDAGGHDTIRIHLITTWAPFRNRSRAISNTYMDTTLYRWNMPGEDKLRHQPTGHDESGPFWDVELTGRARFFFQFKFFSGNGKPEPDNANRVWVAADGAGIWTLSEVRDVLPAVPVERQLTMHFRQEIDPIFPPTMRASQEQSGWKADIRPEPGEDGWTTHRVALYSGVQYSLLFWNPELYSNMWEHADAKRCVCLTRDEECWTLEGDPHLFPAPPERDCSVTLSVALAAPGCALTLPYRVSVRVNRARARLPNTQPGLAFITYPDVVTSFRILGEGDEEHIDRHFMIAESGPPVQRYVVIDRSPVLHSAPPPDMFTDPPFTIRRPGAYEENGEIRFALHAPWCAQVELEGDWMVPGSRLSMRSTKDGSFWWASVPVTSIADAHAGDYHGAEYNYILNGDLNTQDPAAGWAANSSPEARSRLVRRDRYQWKSTNWQTPGREDLRIYQLHPARFSDRAGPDTTPFDRVAWEVTNEDGYFRSLDISTLQLMPVNEVATKESWGYDPALFYAVEKDYGGPDALKRLVDACHERGIAVFLDLVFNHAGTTGNVLWTTAKDTFFDGDTGWGAMINFDHPQVIQFFEQNVVYLLEEYRVDGFRFDFTRVIFHGDEQGEAFVNRAGSGGGWPFLLRLREAAFAVNPRCTFIAENLPNEPPITNRGGPMDSQWCDSFHDCLKDVASGKYGQIFDLAGTLQLSQTQYDTWYNVTNYAESHDEVGNENGRIAHVAGFGRGLRMAKAAAAVVWLSRGLKLMFMGEEAGESRQFFQSRDDVLDLKAYLENGEMKNVRTWVNALLRLNLSDKIHGPSPLTVVYASEQDGLLAWMRGEGSEYFVVVNFKDELRKKALVDLNLPDYTYRELLNSTRPEFQVESETESTNVGTDGQIGRVDLLKVPAVGAVVLERL